MNILIVDDQWEIVSGLVSGISWIRLGITGVFSANSAEEAKEVLNAQDIAIMLCDIEMPGENGIELLRWVRRKKLETECIFLTSHADFSYAQEAIALKSYDYILQPARYEEIIDAVKKAQDKIISDRNIELLRKESDYNGQLNDAMMDLWLQKALVKKADCWNRFDKIIDLGNASTVVKKETALASLHVLKWMKGGWDETLIRSTITNVIREMLGSAAGAVMLKVGSDHFILLISYDAGQLHSTDIMRVLLRYSDFEQKHLDIRSAVYYYGKGIDRCNVMAGIRCLMEYEKQNVMARTGVFLYSADPKQSGVSKSFLMNISKWRSLFENGQGAQIPTRLRQYFENEKLTPAEKYQSLQEAGKGLTHAVLQALGSSRIASDKFFTELFSLQQFVATPQTYEELLRKAEWAVQRYTVLTADPLFTKKDTDEVGRTFEYIQTHLMQKLSREEIASFVHLSPDYLARLVKKKTGLSLMDYIKCQRIEEAKTLLGSTQMSISMIALKCGFSNFSHFSQVFRKETGITPFEYRTAYKGKGTLS